MWQQLLQCKREFVENAKIKSSASPDPIASSDCVGVANYTHNYTDATFLVDHPQFISNFGNALSDCIQLPDLHELCHHLGCGVSTKNVSMTPLGAHSPLLHFNISPVYGWLITQLYFSFLTISPILLHSLAHSCLLFTCDDLFVPRLSSHRLLTSVTLFYISLCFLHLHLWYHFFLGLY